MAADILIYDSNVVPVGRDQKQHVEMTRDIAIKFNEQYGETFVIPEPQIRDEVAVVPGVDGQKMSKSYGNTIEIFGDEKIIRKKIMGITMDSRTPPNRSRTRKKSCHPTFETRRAGRCRQKNLKKLRAGGLGYGDLKKALFENYWNYFADARKKRAELAANLDYVNKVFADGAMKARTLAQKILKRARKNCGLE
jgi:tryptophanyl-tRNA synthetase